MVDFELSELHEPFVRRYVTELCFRETSRAQVTSGGAPLFPAIPPALARWFMENRSGLDSLADLILATASAHLASRFPRLRRMLGAEQWGRTLHLFWGNNAVSFAPDFSRMEDEAFQNFLSSSLMSHEMRTELLKDRAQLKCSRYLKNSEQGEPPTWIVVNATLVGHDDIARCMDFANNEELVDVFSVKLHPVSRVTEFRVRASELKRIFSKA